MYSLILLLFTTLISNVFCQENIIYCVAAPRTLSVAFTRMMYARGDFEVFHEPSMCAYNLIHYPDFVENFHEDSFKSFEEVKKAIFSASIKRPVFVKEMSFAAAEFLLQDPAFMQNEKVHIVFLARNPHHATISFYNRRQAIPHDFPTLIGLEPLYRLYMAASEQAAHPPILLFSEDLYENPEQTVELFCQKVGIPFMPQALSWDKLGKDFDGKSEWHEQKTSFELVQYWHGNAIQSEGFTKPTSYEVDANGEPTFCEIANPEHRQACREARQYNLPFYLKLKEEG